MKGWLFVFTTRLDSKGSREGFLVFLKGFAGTWFPDRMGVDQNDFKKGYSKINHFFCSWLIAAATSFTNKGWGFSTVLFSSGWNCTPMKNG